MKTMNSNSAPWYRRWIIFGQGAAASFLPALGLMTFETQPGHHFSTFLAFWVEILVGPLKYWVPILLGHPRPDALHPMPGISTWVYAVCLPLTLIHPIKPRLLTGCLTAA